MRDLTMRQGRIVFANLMGLLILLVGASTCHATLVMTACSAKQVVIGADGLRQTPGEFRPTTQACKIQQGAERCFFASVGVTHFPDILTPTGKTSHFDMTSMASKVCQGKGTLGERALSFQKSSLDQVRRAMEHIRDYRPEVYAMLHPDGVRARIDVVFVEGGPPFSVAMVGWVEDEHGSIILDNNPIIVSSTSLDGHNKCIYGAGVTQNVLPYERRHPELQDMNDADILHNVISGAISLEGNPPRIGQPIAVLVIDKDGPKWIDQGLCGPISKHPQGEGKSTNSKASSPVR